MAQVSKYLRRVSCNNGDVGYGHYCEGCGQIHIIWVKRPSGGAVWSFNGDVEKPTFGPSVRFFHPEHIDEDTKEKVPELTLCHYLIVDGVQQFCGDSLHESSAPRGNVPLIDLPDIYSDANYGWPGK